MGTELVGKVRRDGRNNRTSVARKARAKQRDRFSKLQCGSVKRPNARQS